ncbi:MAG TPA: GAF domain-containing protein [Anaerolineae bacterium]|nr:GAF domain-containing protein [Anaerolineae bacterium]
MKNTKSLSPGSEASFRAVLDMAVYNALRPAALLLGLVLLAWDLSYFIRPPEIAFPLILTATLSVILLLGFGLTFRRLRLPPRYANAVGASIAGLLIFHRLVGIVLTGEPEQAASLALIVVGAGFVLLSTSWLVAVVAAMLASWLLVSLALGQLAAWALFGLELVSAVALAVIIHTTRLQSLRRQESLRVLNALRNEELERRALQVETLFMAGHSINEILDLDVLLNYVVDLIQERFGYYYVGIFQPDETGVYMISRAGTGASGLQLTREGFRLKIGAEGLIGWVAGNRQPLCIQDVSQDVRYVSTDTVRDTRAETVLPLLVRDIFLGVLDIQSDQLNAFSNDDIQVFTLLADQVAVAIYNAVRYEEERSRRLLTETLFEVGEALSRTLDLKQVLDLILNHLLEIVSFERASVMLEIGGKELEIVAALGFPSESNPLQIRVPLKAEDVFGEIHRTRKPLVIDDVLQRPDWQNVENLPKARSWVGLPFLNAEGEVIGMLSLTRVALEPFTAQQVELAVSFAGHAAFALQNARLYSQLTLAYEQLERLDRTKSDFITVASHELRTPLTLLRGYSQILLKDAAIKANPTQFEMVQGIYNGAVRLHEIVDSMVDMAKIDSRALQLYIESVSLKSLLPKVIHPLEPAIEERRLHLTVAAPDDLPVIRGDSDVLQKVFYHLLINAIKYTPDDGQIAISLRALAPGEYGYDGGVEVVVSDTGIGIDPRYRDFIFAKFYQMGEVALHSSGRTKFKGGGPGLGLAIVKGIVESHGGKIWFESPGYNEETCPGSQFHVVLPLTPPISIGEA